jgi:Secretion system C-terminal sorting domain
MKKIILLCSFFILASDVISQPLVYFDFVTHNEETFQWNGTPYYANNRARLITLADYFQSNGITWNMQSDWVYLTNVLTKDSAYIATTNNKNILLWMQQDKGVEIDPHAHESQYIYPDVVKLMDSLGLPESKLMGGSIYNDSNGVNIWTNLINGQYGLVFPNKFWQPDYMMGGGTPNHIADVKYYGFWNPQSTTNYLTHDTTNHLRHIGVGCSLKIYDTSTVASIVADVKDVVLKVQSGQYPSNGFYLQSIFFEQGSLNNISFYNKVISIADSVNAIVATGVAQWKTLKQAYQQWETVYNAQMFQWECGQVISEIENVSENSFSVYPNPASDKIKIVTGSENKFKDTELIIYNVLGNAVFKSQLINSNNEIDIAHLPKGIYFYRLTNQQSVLSSGKIIIQ